MSWQDKIKYDLKIRTGDQVDHSFIWVPTEEQVDFNGTEFNFIDTPGTLVKKKKRVGKKYPLEFYIQGADHLDLAQEFVDSLANENPCYIEHPYYGNFDAQILSLKLDHTNQNVTKFTCTAIETIVGQGVRTFITPLETIELKKLALDEACEAELTGNPTIQDVTTMETSVEQNYQEGIRIVTVPEEAEQYFNEYSNASNAVQSLIASPVLAIRATVSLLTLPSKFTASVESRVKTLVSEFNILRRTLIGLTRFTGKQLYEIQGATLISSMCIAAINPQDGNYTNSKSVLKIIDTIADNHNLFLSDLDSIQSPNGGNPDYFIPGYTAINLLNEIVNLTLTNLLQIALNGKKEITIQLPYDSNIILLTHKYYGLTDENLNEFIANNNLTYKDMVGLKKGREIVYYI